MSSYGRVFAIMLCLGVTACTATPRNLLATWYLQADPDAAASSPTRVLYLGVLNSGVEQIEIDKLVLNARANAAKSDDVFSIKSRQVLRPGEIVFVRLGDVAVAPWLCRLPASVEIVTHGGSDTVTAETVSLMPTSIPQVWQTRCTTDLVPAAASGQRE